MTDATPGRASPESDDIRITCHACGELRSLADFREADIEGAEPWCASCRDIADELARDEGAGR